MKVFEKALIGALIGISTFFTSAMLVKAQFGSPGPPPPFDDHALMMKKLGLKSMRPGPDPNNQSTFSEVNANRYASSMPDVLTFENGPKVTNAKEWWQRRKHQSIVKRGSKSFYTMFP